MKRNDAVRYIAIFGALAGWAALLLQFVLLMRVMAGQGESFGAAVWRFAGYFTILTNVFTALVLTGAAIDSDRRRGVNAPAVEFSAALSIALVGIVYSLALRAIWNPQGAQKIADMALHDILPLIFCAWFALRVQPGLRFRHVGTALIFPTMYCVFALLRGAGDGWYAYWFLDAAKLSTLQLARNIALLISGFGVMAVIVFAIKRAIDGIARA